MSRYLVWSDEVDDDEIEYEAIEITASGPAEAAERWAEIEDREYPASIASGWDETVHVRLVGYSAVTTYIVTGEMVAEYSARRVCDDGRVL